MLYRDEILDHYRHPQNYGHLKEPTHQAKQANASCGDEIALELKLSSGRVNQVGFTAQGCAISLAAASLISEHIKGKTVEQIARMRLDDVINLMGGELNPGRHKCALLPLQAIKTAIK